MSDRNATLEEAATIADTWSDARSDELRLRGGEMTAQEIRTVRAFLKAVALDIRSRKTSVDRVQQSQVLSPCGHKL